MLTERQQLIPLARHDISGVTVQTVDAHALHAFLEVGKDFSPWVKERITQYGFAEGQDYVVADSPNLGNQTGRRGARVAPAHQTAVDEHAQSRQPRKENSPERGCFL